MPIPTPNEKRCETRRGEGGISLPVLGDGGVDPKRKVGHSRMGKIRAGVLILVHVLIAVHIGLWLASGRKATLAPVEPSEAMYTLEQGLVNAGFIFFLLAMASTALFGRFFCGWACHLVALQDLCAWLLKKVGIRPRPFRSRLLLWAPLGLALYMFVWPTFVREVVKPLSGERWESMKVYLGDVGPRPRFRSALTKEDFWETFEKKWYVIVPFFGVCGFAAVYFLGSKGFCTYGCPYGGFFAPLDRVAPVRIRVTDACEHCGHCTAVCTSNVRVHEEVRDYGMVVDPGCMKCLDCVSVCPNDALYVGLGKPALRATAKAGAKIKPRAYDLSWPEEVAAAGLFMGFLLAFRNMANHVPLLMAVGLAGIGTYVCWKAWRMVREPSVRLQNLQLKLKGAWRPAGYALVAFAVLMVGTALWSGTVRARLYAASVLDELITTPQEVVFRPGYTPAEEDRRRAERALAHFRFAGPLEEGGFGWARAIDHYIRMAWLSSVAGRVEDAEGYLRRGIAQAAERRAQAGPGLVEGLGMVLSLRGMSTEQIAAEYRRLAGEHPDQAQVQLALARGEAFLGRVEPAVAAAEAAAAAGPEDAEVAVASADLLMRLGRMDRAKAVVERGLSHRPRHGGLLLGAGLLAAAEGRVEEAEQRLRDAHEVDPENPAPMAYLAELCRSTGRAAEAAEWDQRAQKAREAHGHQPR